MIGGASSCLVSPSTVPSREYLARNLAFPSDVVKYADVADKGLVESVDNGVTGHEGISCLKQASFSSLNHSTSTGRDVNPAIAVLKKSIDAIRDRGRHGLHQRGSRSDRSARLQIRNGQRLSDDLSSGCNGGRDSLSHESHVSCTLVNGRGSRIRYGFEFVAGSSGRASSWSFSVERVRSRYAYQRSVHLRMHCLSKVALQVRRA